MFSIHSFFLIIIQFYPPPRAGFLYSRYRPDCAAWEPVILLRQLAVIVALLLFKSTTSQVGVGAYLLLAPVTSISLDQFSLEIT